MRAAPSLALALALVLVSVQALAGPAGAAEPLLLRAQARALAPAVPRLGLNLGGASTWGAEQLMHNLVKNPGFEVLQERSLFILSRIDGATVYDDTAWLGRADGHWDGARFDVRSGAAAGRGGAVLASARVDAQGVGSLRLDPWPAGLQVGDAVVVGVDSGAPAPPLWWVGHGHVVASTAEQRTGSPGQQAVRLDAPAALHHHFDTLGERAGKLLLLRGRWHLAFWARAAAAGARLQVTLRRAGALAVLDEQVALTPRWQLFEYDFGASDDGPAAPVSLSFTLAAGQAWLDDVFLGSERGGAGGFRPEVLELLRRLRPGYLRDWQGQLGDSLANRLAEPFARHPVRYRPGQAEQLYLYSLPQFLALCAAVDALPWVVAPSLLDDAEWRALGAYLARAAAQYGFAQILVEFGNENWNALFRPAGFAGAALQGAVAGRGFALLQAGAGSYRGIVPLVNAQYVNPPAWGALAAAAPAAGRVAVAPYFLNSLDAVTPQAARAAAFAEDDALLRAGVAQAGAHGKAVAVAEVNFHTLGGGAGAALRNYAVAAPHAGAALARRLMQATLAGVREQAVYTLAGYDSRAGQDGLVQLFGIARDLAPGTLRPTGQALALLNSVYGGALHASRCDGGGAACAAVTALWSAPGGSLLVVSAAPSPLLVRTDVPCAQRRELLLLDGAAAGGAAGGAGEVALQRGVPACTGAWQFLLPPYSLALLRGSAP